MTDPTEQTAAEFRQLRQDVWDALGILGFDHDGDKTPDALVYPSLGTVLKEYAREVREGWDEALDLMPSEADLAIAARVRACTPVRANYLFGPQYVEVAGETFASARALLHVNPDGSAVMVTDEGVSAPTEPAVDLTDVVRGLTLDTDVGRFTWDQGVRLRMYRFTDDEEGDQP